MSEKNELGFVEVPYPEVQLLIENGARRLCLILEQREPWNDIKDPEVRALVNSLGLVFECLDKWRAK
jgi:hypothetical protein